MIICDRDDWAREQHAFHPVINQAISWIAGTDLSALPTGKYDILPDNQMFCILQEMNTEPAADRPAEAHFNYVDIQYLLKGKESIGVARANAANVITEDYAQERDIVFYQQVVNESMIHLEPGMFAVFFPHDVHRPCCQTHGTSALRKAVIKINLSLFS
ncbi:YhcH/YjgK/YiaL family protein [Erwiniaceae bacterium BAC15a-03b]|uniref:YhcH/YjgK/YiaL family protein n=1 Tax=Winslowiella arboricola TaxID=2978220 RepID=A0A9J6PWG2_9GAMM|nr:YhcH/YjgK/YiaL family protein [Winslowiella arboricola]MCU5774795.1 YhcH/YjgK/YiaL family protein [Winslowiella arboricola]MCU5780053.1 YhcH/YjgK/YiaL family protein [Winslowiella arboricola]